MVTMFRSLSMVVRVARRSHPKKSADSTRFRAWFQSHLGWRGTSMSPVLRGHAAGRQAALHRTEQPLQAPALHALHHPLHIEELLHQPIHILNLHARAPRDPPAPGAVDDAGHAPLPRGHGIDDGDLAANL